MAAGKLFIGAVNFDSSAVILSIAEFFEIVKRETTMQNKKFFIKSIWLDENNKKPKIWIVFQKCKEIDLVGQVKITYLCIKY